MAGRKRVPLTVVPDQLFDSRKRCRLCEEELPLEQFRLDNRSGNPRRSSQREPDETYAS